MSMQNWLFKFPMQKLKKLPWTYACGSREETKWRNIETTSEFSDDEEM